MMANTFRIGRWRVDVRLGSMSRGSQAVHLEPQVMKVLAYLASKPRQVVTKDELLDALWNGGVASDAALARCISRIRVTFGDDPRRPQVIETIPKIGYRLVADVRPADAGPAPRRRWQRLAGVAAALLVAIAVASRFTGPAAVDVLAGHDEEAAAAYRKGLELYGRYTYPFNQNAIVHFERALAIEPDFALAHAGLSDALVQEAHYWRGDRAADALQHAERAVELEPGRVEAVRALGKALAINGFDERALDAFERALAIDPDDWVAALQSANLHFRRLEFDEAETLYLAALERAPNLDVAMSNLGFLYLKSGDTDSARHWFNRALELFPLQQQAAARLAMLEMFTGHPRDARSRCLRLVRSYPNNYACLQLLAVTSLGAGDYDAALDEFARVLDAFPEDRYARLGKAKALLARADLEEAAGLVENVLAETNEKIARGESDAYDYWLVAGCHTVLGNNALAYEWFDKAAAAGRRFFLWDASDPIFANLRGDSRFDHYIAATRPARSSRGADPRPGN